MKRSPEVEIVWWTHPRLPPSHPLYERWSIMFEGQARLTFGTAADAINETRINGWTVVRTLASEER